MSGFWHRFGERYPSMRFAITVLPLVVLLIAANNQRQDKQKRHSDAQFRKALIVTDQKFRQALRVTTQQFAYAQNRSVCGWRTVLGPTRKDKRLPQKRRDQIESFLDTQITIPFDFKCSTLPKKPPKAEAEAGP